ncbi:uncharacterized protein FIBRA_06548 [Fibroporia radiculosa]|uniref:FAD-binding domain-containing protein n=1 Tax=Fibroporia radiculosa TaxID=599839 RepID=J4H449_9APHY|nr:uncharacterized protein FIBRA_06548 [Fibroporia radiculosa]CCM04374.1 predicted protein [Fibroporia radiculosa]
MTEQTSPILSIEFIIVGGGIAGLSAACALSKVGHKVTVLDQGDDFLNTEYGGGCRLAPNMTKKFYEWGLEEELRKYSIVGQYLTLARYETGEVASSGEWGEKFELDRAGEYIQLRFSALRRLLYEAALRFGATVRPNSVVKTLHPEPNRPSVILESGEELSADVLVGADGNHSISRQTMLGCKEALIRKSMVMYDATIPRDKMAADPDLDALLTNNQYGKLMLWHGDGRGASGYEITKNAYCMQVYAPGSSEMPFPVSVLSSEELVEVLGECDLRLRKLAALANNVLAIPVIRQPQLTDWVHPNGKFIAIGEAAHPLITGTVYTAGLAAEDGIMLGKMFSYLRYYNQITPFLSAVEDVRQKRVADALEAQSVNPTDASMPAGIDAQESLKVMESIADGTLSLDEVNDLLHQALGVIFAYDPEEEAEHWWVHWGLLRERAGSGTPVIFDPITVLQEQENEFEQAFTDAV